MTKQGRKSKEVGRSNERPWKEGGAEGGEGGDGRQGGDRAVLWALRRQGGREGTAR